MRRHTRKMRGGFWDSLTKSVSGWGSSLSNPFKKSSTTTSTSTTYTPTTTTTLSTTPPVTSGGRRRRRSKRYRGGFSASKSLNDVASYAASFTGKTAQPQAWVGGKSKRRRHHKHNSSCKHKH